MIAAYNTLKEAVDRQLKRNKFSCVNITGIFSNINFNSMKPLREDFDNLASLSDDTDKEV